MGLFREVGTQLNEWVDKPVEKGTTARRTILAVVSFVLLVIIFSRSLAPESFDIRAGQIAPQDIKATKEIVDRARTEKLREEKAAQVRDVYEQDARILEQVLSSIQRAFAAARVISGDKSLKTDKKIDGLLELSDATEQAAAAFLRADKNTVDALETAARNVATKIERGGVAADSLEPYRKAADTEMEVLKVSKDLRAFAAGIVKRSLRPNLVLNQTETFRLRREARDSVQPVRVQKGQLIIRAGEVISEDQMVLLRDMGIIKVGPDVSTIAASAVYALVLMAAVGMYMVRFDRATLSDSKQLLLVVIVFFGTLLFAGVLNRVSGYLMPVAVGTMVLTIMMDARFALLMAIILSVSASIMTGSDMRFFLTALLGSTVGVFGVARLDDRSDLMRAGLGVGLMNIASVAAFTLSDGIAGFSQPALERYFWGLMNGVVSAILSMGLLPFLEGMFNVITPMKLIELSNPNQPLLKKLLVEAPGTYHHSVVVGNLAEAAAEAAGGNSLLARVGAYYHDVGKTKRPYFFIENQMGLENPHDKTSPTLSTLIITSHVRDGVEMAREHKLPEPIINFIREHHGTTLVSYFYKRAAESGNSEEVVEADFRYEGPRPSSKETAIVMLADSVEAAVRAMDKPAPARIEQAVKRIIGERLTDHQLDRCDLTLRDLDTIAGTFTRVLSGMFHPRIEYPDYDSKTDGGSEGGEKPGGSDPVQTEAR